MTVLAHIDALHEKHTYLEAELKAEGLRPMPDFAQISKLKKQKLKLKEEIAAFESTVPKWKSAKG